LPQLPWPFDPEEAGTLPCGEDLDVKHMSSYINPPARLRGNSSVTSTVEATIRDVASTGRVIAP
jgi:hypothetical protein